MKQKQPIMWILFLLLALSILLAACSAVPTTGQDTDESDARTGRIDDASEAVHTDPSASDEQPREAAPSEGTMYARDTVTLADARVFSEGIAWVQYYDNAGELQFGWLHPDGSISHPFPIDRVTAFGSDFSSGYSYVTTGDGFIHQKTEVPDSFIILDQSGAVTAESPNDGSSYEILCGGDGAYLVKQSVRSMTANEDRYGFISADGNWLYECAVCEIDGEHPLSASGVREYRAEDNIKFSYLGESVFHARYDERQSVFYNCATGKTYRITGDDQDVQVYDSFSEGYIPVKVEGTLYLLSTGFEMKPIAVDEAQSVCYGDGIIYTTEYMWGMGKNGKGGKFYRLDGSVLADLTEYKLLYHHASDLFRFRDGYAAAIIYGLDEEHYLGIIGMDGAFSFEPIKIDLSGFYTEDKFGELSDGRIACKIAYQEGDSWRSEVVVVDTEGNITHSDYFTSEDAGRLIFHEGFAWDNLNQCFLRDDGTVLETYLNG